MARAWIERSLRIPRRVFSPRSQRLSRSDARSLQLYMSVDNSISILRYALYLFILFYIFLDSLGIYFYTHLAIEGRTLPIQEHKLFCKSPFPLCNKIQPNHLHELVFCSYQPFL
jgi:hypothetical protein